MFAFCSADSAGARRAQRHATLVEQRPDESLDMAQAWARQSCAAGCAVQQSLGSACLGAVQVRLCCSTKQPAPAEHCPLCSWVYHNPLSSGSSDPAPLPQAARNAALQYSHMGMLAPLANGSLLAAWQAAPVFWEGSRQQDIYGALSQDAGATWTPPARLAGSGNGLPLWAPVLHTEVRLWPAPASSSCHARLDRHERACRPTAPGCSARPARSSAGGTARYEPKYSAALLLAQRMHGVCPQDLHALQGGLHFACGGDLLMQLLTPDSCPGPEGIQVWLHCGAHAVSWHTCLHVPAASSAGCLLKTAARL